jgi:hypothetical protein
MPSYNAARNTEEELFSRLLLTPDKHTVLLHPLTQRGVATVARSAARWAEKAVRVGDLPDHARQLVGVADIFMSQQTFYGWRRIAQLAQLGAAYVDLDFHKTSWRSFTPGYVANQVLCTLDDQGMPPPSCILFTGRGLLCLWLHDIVPRSALPRWNAIQKVLAGGLKGFGADACALDAARVFRLAGTVNSKSGEMVRLIWSDGLEPTRWAFDTLADEVLPVARAEIHSLAAERAKRKAEGTSVIAPATRLTAGTWWETVLSDLQKLRRVRWFGGLPSGQRDTWLFLAVNAMSWLCPPTVLRREAFALAQECGGWRQGEAEQRFGSIFRRAQMSARGVMVEWNGERVDARYRFRAETITQWLNITPAEMREGDLRALGDEAHLRANATQREADRRRRAGARSRDEQVVERLEVGLRALELQQMGMTRDQIAITLGASTGFISKAMADARARSKS